MNAFLVHSMRSRVINTLLLHKNRAVTSTRLYSSKNGMFRSQLDEYHKNHRFTLGASSVFRPQYYGMLDDNDKLHINDDDLSETFSGRSIYRYQWYKPSYADYLDAQSSSVFKKGYDAIETYVNNDKVGHLEPSVALALEALERFWQQKGTPLNH